ncbi:MAG: sulfotransferase [Candidatus Competibacteraceae bacterium]|nr:MAG: sulfotransferase [Candidatus Competibacteraceae bacterium]
MLINFRFLIIGAGRGGTSLIAALLDSHPRLTVAFERFAKEYLMGQALSGQETLRFDVRADAFYQACIIEAGKYPEHFWGNKITTEQLHGLEQHNHVFPDQPVEVMEVFFNQVLAQQKLVFILRDGRTCVRSKMARTGQTLEIACERWLYSVRIYEFLSRHPRAICIRYESLLTDPVETLGSVCEFLGIRYDQAMLEGTQHSRMNPDYRYPGFDTSKLSLSEIPEGCERRLEKALRDCGYLYP